MHKTVPDNIMGSDQTRFTHDELISALIEARENLDDDGVRTSTELRQVLGISDKTFLKRVRILIAAGKVEVAKKRVINVWGIETTTRGYRLVE